MNNSFSTLLDLYLFFALGIESFGSSDSGRDVIIIDISGV
jgi:hypothetical protein